MANEDIIGITVNGETVANFSVPNVGHKLKAGEYQIVNVGGILEISVALVKDGGKFEGTFSQCIDQQSSTPNNTLAASFSQVDLHTLSPASIGNEGSNLKRYDDIVMDLPPVLAHSWSMKFLPPEKQVPFSHHPQHQQLKEAAILHDYSLPQPSESAVSVKLQVIQFCLFLLHKKSLLHCYQTGCQFFVVGPAASWDSAFW